MAEEKNKFIISLTSYPARIGTVNQTIESLLNQTYKADKVVLWLGEDKFQNKENDLPQELLDLTQKGLTIGWCKDIRSYTKLVPALKEYPNDNIITADDDIIYPENWLEKLVLSFEKNPEYIHCHRAHLVCLNKDKSLKPYREWFHSIYNVQPSFNNFLTGVGGVIYPPNSLHKDIFDEEKFMQLAPTADDIWFWAMAVLNNTKIYVIKDNITDLKYVSDTQESPNCLWKTNVTENGNDKQLENVLKTYPEIKTKLKIIKYNRQNLSFLEKIFSVTNQNGENYVKHKVITILGIKIKFKSKK